MRGSAHNSAAIARIGDVDTQFSHIAIIYIDDEGKHWVVEALIEDGSVINTLEHVLDHGLGRAVLYRHKDAALAARAAKMVHSRVLATKTGVARTSLMTSPCASRAARTLFCAKLVQQAFLDASGGKTKLPEFKTRLDRKPQPCLLQRASGSRRARRSRRATSISIRPSISWPNGRTIASRRVCAGRT